MKSFASRARLQSESGFSLVELVVTVAILGFIMAGLTNMLVSGERASYDGQARLTSQQNVQVALTRLEFDARCASAATLLNKTGSNGAGVYLSLPSQCSHSNGNVSYCVSSGSLVRVAGTTCGTGVTLVSGITSATPFSCYTPSITGAYPQLQVALAVDIGGSSDASSATDTITMRNSTTSSCS